MAKRRNRKFKIVLLALPVLLVVGLLVWYLHGHTVAVLSPAGPVAHKERNLMAFAILLSAIVVIPVYAMAIMIALKYHENNHEARKVKYSPDWDGSRLLESIWWGVPIAIIGVLSVITWDSSHALDPYKPLASSVKPLTVQVVALDWKWLFIYPQQHVASVNKVEMPVNTPVDFQITSDSVMNSFWIPQLGSQIYAMPGMSTQVHLMADKMGSFYGSPANIAGSGFARMTFTADSVSVSDFNNWVNTASHSSKQLDSSAYTVLAQPSQSNPVVYFSHTADGLYDQVVSKYMGPPSVGMDM
jgi:cytochrome o ubiquinol oxidase subunit II